MIVTDISSGSPVSKKMSFQVLDTLIDVTQGQANSSFIQANAAFIHANSGFIKTNASFSHANSGFIQANASYTSVNAAYSHANASYVQANTATNLGNQGITDAAAALLQATSAYGQANLATAYSTSAGSYANSAFIAANSASATDTTQNNSITAAFNHANSAFDSANAATATDTTQNNSITSAFIHANSGFDFANVAANLALSFSATTILEVLNNGSSAYRFTQYGALDNPNVSTFSATTLGFKLNVSGHPFHIRTGDNTADYNTGLVHVSTTGTLSYDSAAQGKESGTLFWRIPHNAVGNYKYRCVNHPGAMIGDINIANTANIYFTHST